VCDLREVFHYSYQVDVPSGLTEHEVVHVFFGVSHEPPALNPTEASDFRYMACDAIRRQMAEHPHHFTEWFKLSFDRVLHAKFGDATATT
jgi:isopentenyl-diphosphate delta-isomerase